MSPVSRGRKGKNKNKNKGKPRTGNPHPAAVDRGPLVLDFRTGHAPQAHDARDSGPGDVRDLVREDMLEHVVEVASAIARGNVAIEHATGHALGASAGLLNAAGPRELEQATAELLGAELASPMMDGARTDMFSRDLVEIAYDRVRSNSITKNDEWRGAWWLLHGLASIGSLGNGGYAAQKIAAVRAPAGEPPWLGLVPLISATGKVHELHDTWGLRFGVIAEFAYPGGADPHVYLLDVDAHWDIRILRAGVFDDVPAAEAAWRAALPPGEAPGQLGPITKTSLGCLYQAASTEELMSRDEPLLTEHYRAERRINDILTKLGSRRVAPAFEPDPEAFAAWYQARHGYDPEDDLAGLLAEEWSLGTVPATAHLLSPRRAAGFRDSFLESFYADEEDVRKVIPEWIRWAGEKTGAAKETVEASVAALG